MDYKEGWKLFKYYAHKHGYTKKIVGDFAFA